MIYPDSLNKSIEYLKKFQGIGDKSAERMALSMLDMPIEDVENLSKYLLDARKSLGKCNRCNSLTDNEICNICKLSDDGLRDVNTICVLEDYKSVFAFEKSGKYNGTYHVLGGLISPVDGVGPDDINISSLIKRVDSLSNPEIIIALRPSLEGETTTLYIKKIFENKNVSISRLSYGIPMGVELDYLDELTLINALNDRKKIS